MSEERVRFSLNLPGAMREDLASIAEQVGIPVASIIKMALLEYLTNNLRYLRDAKRTGDPK